ncbi:MAG: GNAT family N-acetyltransferase [Bdellovibrionales bacterium]|nr:GNAT family N-acetyltransferase [Bdellovibrionales bacterium]
MSNILQAPIELSKVSLQESELLKDYIEALYRFEEDYESIVNIEEGLKSLFKNEALATPYFIKQGPEKIGYLILTRYHSVEKGGLTIYIDELYVEERFRRRGVGKTILDQVVSIGQREKAKALWANTEHNNEGAQRFFKNAGFRKNRYLNFERAV